MQRLKFLLLLSVLAFGCRATENNIIVGTAKLTVVINHPDSVNIDNAVVWVDTAPVFIDAYDNRTSKLEKNGNSTESMSMSTHKLPSPE